jgi:molybdopterin-containing oxidoreductase family iron-sulfur binding subunit
MNNDLGKMVLNPDVTVRSRGVMEKCSFCVQRIQEGKLNARKEKRELVDGDVSVACGVACPTDAIVFGDVNDNNSKINNLLKVKSIDKATLKLEEERAYAVLDEIRVSPNVWYLRKVRNKKKV